MTPTKKREWFEDEAFWRDLYPFMFPESRLAEPEAVMDDVLELLQPQGTRVLDLACGPGRWSVAFAQRGFTVTGVDRTKYLLDKARARARAAGVKIEWMRQDMREFVRPAAFDVVLSMFTSFGYFDRKGEDALVLANIFKSLRPGGSCLMELAGKEILARIFLSTSCESLSNGAMLFERREVFDDWTRIRNDWTIVHRGRAKTLKFHHTIYSGHELRGLMENAGFERVKLYGSLQGLPYDNRAQRLVVIGRKPDRRSSEKSGPLR